MEDRGLAIFLVVLIGILGALFVFAIAGGLPLTSGKIVAIIFGGIFGAFFGFLAYLMRYTIQF